MVLALVPAVIKKKKRRGKGKCREFELSSLMYITRDYITDLKTFPLYHNVRLCHLLAGAGGAVEVTLPAGVGATVGTVVAFPVLGS